MTRNYGAILAVLLCLLGASSAVPGGAPSSADLQRLDATLQNVVATSGQPGAVLVVAQNGTPLLERAYGYADLGAGRRMTTDTPLEIGSITKQFTAAAILLLAEQGKLSLDDRVSRFFPDLGHADQVTIRQLLTHTSGISDYIPLDFCTPDILTPIDPRKLAAQWAAKPLDFPPGTQWQYSNTGYTILGNIIEKVSGMTVGQFLDRYVFARAGLTHTHFGLDYRSDPPPATGYTRFAFSMPRVSPTMAPGQVNADGGIVTTAADLVAWNRALFGGKVLQPSSLRAMTTPVILPNGTNTHYGFGVGIRTIEDQEVVSHGGETCGFTATYFEVPQRKLTVVLLTNSDFFLSLEVVNAIYADALHLPNPQSLRPKTTASATPASDSTSVAFVGKWIADFANGTVDRSQLTPDFRAYLTSDVLAAAQKSLTALGKPISITPLRQGLRGGMQFASYEVKFPTRDSLVLVYHTKDGKIAEFIFD